MSACSFWSLNLAACLSGQVAGWFALVPWWAWAAIALIIVGIVYRLAGWLGLIGLAGAFGYWLGRRGPDPFPHEDLQRGEDGPEMPRQIVPAKPRVRTIFDILRGR